MYNEVKHVLIIFNKSTIYNSLAAYLYAISKYETYNQYWCMGH